MIRMCLIPCILPFFWICPWPAACYLRRWRRLRRSVKEAGGSRFFSSLQRKLRRRRFLSFFFAAHWHWATLTLILTLTLALVYWHWQVFVFMSRFWKSSDRIILASMLKQIFMWGKKRGLVQGCAQLKRVIRAVRREPVQQLGLRRPSLSMSLKSTWYYLISLGIAWPRFCTAWNR